VPHEIDFPDSEPRFDFDSDCLAFRARVDGRPVECVLTAELLMTHFGAEEPSEEAMRAAYRDHRPEIQSIARDHIENGWIDEGRLFLTRRFTRLNVTFADRIRESPILRALVDSAQRMLAEIIGPNADTVAIVWDTDLASSHHPDINLRITDPSLPYSDRVKISSGGKVEADPIKDGMMLAISWGRILRQRARKLTILSG
jgi:hypothetical protein